jgi:hypothetical protein
MGKAYKFNGELLTMSGENQSRFTRASLREIELYLEEELEHYDGRVGISQLSKYAVRVARRLSVGVAKLTAEEVRWHIAYATDWWGDFTVKGITKAAKGLEKLLAAGKEPFTDIRDVSRRYWPPSDKEIYGDEFCLARDTAREAVEKEITLASLPLG